MKSIFPDEIRQGRAKGAEVFVNASNDGMVRGTAAAYAQHLKQGARGARWRKQTLVVRDTKHRGDRGTSIQRPGLCLYSTQDPGCYGCQLWPLTNVTKFYTRHGTGFVICVR